MTSTDPHGASSHRPGRFAGTPRPLLVACALTGLEAVALVVQGLLSAAEFDPDNAGLTLTSLLFFAGYGAGLAWCAWRLAQRESWARAPLVLAQAIQVLVGVNAGPTTFGTLCFFVGVAVLVGVFHPASLRALAAAEEA